MSLFSVSVEARAFEHFLLPEVSKPDPGGAAPFMEYEPLTQTLLPPETFASNTAMIDFFERNRARVQFGPLRPSNGYYYDSKARTHSKLVVMLIGALWQPETRRALDDFEELWHHYSYEYLNKNRLKESAAEWIEEVHSGPDFVSFYWNQKPLSHLHTHYELMRKLDFVPNVSFLFVQAGGVEADASEYRKDIGVPIPFLHDEQIELTLKYKGRLTPTLVLANLESRIEYEGKPLSIMGLKTRIDKMLLPVWEQMGAELQAANHEKRVQEVLAQRARELARRRERARQRKQSERGEALKKMQSSDPSVNQVDVKDLSYY